MNVAKKNKRNYINTRSETELNWEALLSLRKFLFVMVDIFVLFFASIIIIIIINITAIVLYALRSCIIFIAYFSDGTARQCISYSLRSWNLQTLEEPKSKILFYVGYRSFRRGINLAMPETQYFLVITIKPLKTKRSPLHLKTQSVPRCKHFSSRL